LVAGAAVGSKIVFMSDRDGPDPVGHLGRKEIYIMNPDGSDQTRLTENDFRESFPVVSPDGQRIAFSEEIGGGVDIFIMNVDGTGLRRLTNLTEQRLGARRPAWSRDGSKLAFETFVKPDIYVIRADGTELVNLTKSPEPDGSPAWSPDGQRMAFVRIQGDRPVLYVMNADGTNPLQLSVEKVSKPGGGWWVAPKWSPDGRRIAFVSDRDGNHEIYTIDPDGKNPVRLTNNTAEDGHPSWSPDGRQIAFHRRVLGHGQIFVMNADGTAQHRITELSSVAFNGFPSWGRAATKSPAR
jgi:Tol biopolymer transport system component